MKRGDSGLDSPAPEPRLLWLVVLVVAAAILAYLDSFSGVFLFDDHVHIVDNEAIRTMDLSLNDRPLVALSLALNYRFGRLDVWGYHAFNLAVHLLATVVLFGIVQRTLRLDRFRETWGARAPWVAAAVAVLWAVHPLQTQSVTYVIQRGESMAGLFYLLTVYCVLRGATSARARAWFAAAIGACALGMGCKPIVVTAPCVVLLFDAAILTGSLRETLRRRWGLYAGLAATWALLLVTGLVQRIFFTAVDPGVGAGYGTQGMSAVGYALSQPGVILHYLRLVYWPHPLCLDYWWPVARTAGEVVPYAIGVAALLAGTAWALFRRPWLGFLGAWFFLILAPTSSIVPIRDVAVEHRMYLPLAAVVVLTVVGADRLLAAACARLAVPLPAGRAVNVVLVALAAGLLGWRTIERNRDYHDEAAMWSDIVALRPENPRAQANVGFFLMQEGRMDEAVTHCREAIRLDPNFAPAYLKLHAALLGAGRGKEASAVVVETIRRAMQEAGGGLPGVSDAADAAAAADELARLRTDVQENPDDAGAHRRLGMMLSGQKSHAEAIAELEKAARLDPKSSGIHEDLGAALMAGGRTAEAIDHFVEALRLDPSATRLSSRIGIALALRGDVDETVARYPDVDLRAAQAQAHTMSADRLLAQNRREEAAAQYRRALAIDPDSAHARQGLASLEQ